MKNHVDPLMSVIAELEDDGWYVDYLEQAGSIQVGPTPKHTEIISSFQLAPEEAELGIRFDVQTQYHFKKHAKQFLEHLASMLHDLEIDFGWQEPKSFHIAWRVKLPLLYSEIDSSELLGLLIGHVFAGQRLVFAFNHALRTCARQAKKHQKLPPADLAIFAIKESKGLESMH